MPERWWMLFVARREARRRLYMVCNDMTVWLRVPAICPLYFLDITQDISVEGGQEVTTLHHNIITRTRHSDPLPPPSPSQHSFSLENINQQRFSFLLSERRVSILDLFLERESLSITNSHKGYHLFSFSKLALYTYILHIYIFVNHV